MSQENKTNQIKGEFQDTIIHTDTGKVEVKEWDTNIIVDSITNLSTALLKAQSGYSAISYWAIGSGLGSWDNVSPTPASVSDTKLTTEFFRKFIPLPNIVWVNSGGGVSVSPTNRLRISLTFADTEAVGTWREFGIYGGNATATKDSGIMINHKNHGMLVKTNAMIVERQIVFTFN